MKHLFYLSTLLLMLAACSDGENKQVSTLKKETMDIHDEAMKDLAEMNRVSRALKEFMTIAIMTREQSTQFTAALVAIDKADEDMSTWMREYEAPEGKDATEAIRYLQVQKHKMETNRNDIRAAIEGGKKLLAPPAEK